MRLTGLLPAVALLSMLVAPVTASPVNPASNLSLASDTTDSGGPDTTAPAKSHSGVSTTALLIGLGIVGVVAGAVALSHHDSKAASA